MAFKKEKGIYKITCLVNNKCYIGQSNGLRERLYHQKYYLNKNQSHHLRLQSDWVLYGQENFKFEVLEYTDNLDYREKYWIKFYDSFENGYNTTTGGIFENKQDIYQRIKRSKKLSGKNNPMFDRGKGEGNPNCKLKEKQVIEIKIDIKDGIDNQKIMKKYNLTKSQFQKIKHNRTWGHVLI